MQERIPFRQSFADDFRACLAVSDGSQTVGCDAVCYQVLYHGFCPALGEADVVFIPSPIVAMRAEFNRDVRIVFHERDEGVQCEGRRVCEFRTVESVKHIVYQYGSRDRSQFELKYVFFAYAAGVHSQLFFMIQESLART